MHSCLQNNSLRSVNKLDEDTAITSNGPVKLTPVSCHCSGFQSMGLLCSHILALRKMKDSTQHCPNVVNQRWTKSYNKAITHPMTTTTRDDVPQGTTMPKRGRRVLGHNEKFRKASVTPQTIASKLARGMASFEQKLAQLELAKTYIEQNKDFTTLLDANLSQFEDLPKSMTCPSQPINHSFRI